MAEFVTIIFFGLGLIIGSFLNVVVYRFNTQKSLGGRSACMSCRNQLSWYELLPVVSYVFLKGRCKSCQSKISAQYPAVELASGIIFATLFWKFQGLFFADTVSFTITYAYYTLMFSLLLVIAVYDVKHKIIPDMLALVFGVLAFTGIFLFDASGFNVHLSATLEYFSGLFLALPFALIWLVSRGAWMGLGDAKLIIGMGYLVGFSMALSGIVLAFWSGAVIGIILIALSRKGMKSEVPFAPFLVLGVFISFICSVQLFSYFY